MYRPNPQVSAWAARRGLRARLVFWVAALASVALATACEPSPTPTNTDSFSPSPSAAPSPTFHPKYPFGTLAWGSSDNCLYEYVFVAWVGEPYCRAADANPQRPSSHLIYRRGATAAQWEVAIDTTHDAGFIEWYYRTVGYWEACPKDNCTNATTQVQYLGRWYTVDAFREQLSAAAVQSTLQQVEAEAQVQEQRIQANAAEVAAQQQQLVEAQQQQQVTAEQQAAAQAQIDQEQQTLQQERNQAQAAAAQAQAAQQNPSPANNNSLWASEFQFINTMNGEAGHVWTGAECNSSDNGCS